MKVYLWRDHKTRESGYVAVLVYLENGNELHIRFDGTFDVVWNAGDVPSTSRMWERAL